MTPRTTCRFSRRLHIASGCACVLDEAGTVIEPCYAHLEQKNGSRVQLAERPHQGAATVSAQGWAREPISPPSLQSGEPQHEMRLQ